MQLLQALAAHEGELRDIPKTVDSQTEAVAQLNNGLKEIANQVRAATSPNISGIKAELFNHEALSFGPKFKALSLKFISQVTSPSFMIQLV